MIIYAKDVCEELIPQVVDKNSIGKGIHIRMHQKIKDANIVSVSCNGVLLPVTSYKLTPTNAWCDIDSSTVVSYPGLYEIVIDTDRYEKKLHASFIYTTGEDTVKPYIYMKREPEGKE